MHFLVKMCLIFYSYSLFSAEVLLLGGGGESMNKPNTMFDDSLKIFGDSVNIKANKLNVSFNGGHPNTEEIIKNNLKINDNKKFIASNAKSMIKDYYDKIKNGEIKKSESLVIIIDTHGGPKDSNLHLLSTVGDDASNPNEIKKNSDGFYASDFKMLTEIAKEKGINLGIVDLSCHSGSSLDLANSNTCVITSAGPENYGTPAFTNEFYKAIGEGVNLEDAFLRARKVETAPSFPMISTEAGKKVSDEIYKLINPYLSVLYRYDNGTVIDKLSATLEFYSKAENQCKREVEFKALIKNIEDLLLVGKLSYEESSARKELIRSLKKYKEFQDEYITKYQKMGIQHANDKVDIEYEDIYTKKMKKKSMGLDLLINGEFKTNLESYTKKLKNSDPIKNKEAYLSNKEMVTILSAYVKKQDELLRKYPTYKEKSNVTNDLLNLGNKVYFAARDVSKLANKYYEESYSRQLKVENPCSKIFLKK